MGDGWCVFPIGQKEYENLTESVSYGFRCRTSRYNGSVVGRSPRCLVRDKGGTALNVLVQSSTP